MTTQVSSGTNTTAYVERLSVSWWMWPATLSVVGIVGLEVLFGFPTCPIWVPFAVVLPVTTAALLRAGRIRVAVSAGEFQVDDARLPVTVIADVVALDTAGKREALGVGAHPHAFVIQRPWIGPAVQVLLDDPNDPTPYWIVSTRRPVPLATALLAAKRQAKVAPTS